MNQTEDHAIRFAEWACRSYMRLNGCWVHRYSDQRNIDNHKSTKELYDLWLANYEYLSRKEEPK